jgi:hypothetical protein
MSPEAPSQDPQDKAFGAAASRDQQTVDELERRGVTMDELPDEPTRHPRSAGKADPTPDSEQDATGERAARRNQAEDPPA